MNGFMEYLRQNSQMLHNGEVIATDSQKVREEIEVALKKDSRREGRRLKRQAAKKNAICFHCRQLAMGLQIALLPLRIKKWALEYVTGVDPQVQG